MKKILCEGNGTIKLMEDQIPSPGYGEALVRVHYVSLCGSDYRLFDGTYQAPHQYPLVLGHEWSGEIVSLGDAVSGFECGDRVTGDCSVFCGMCDHCKYDLNLCRSIEKHGITTDGFAVQYRTVDARYLHRAPVSLDFDVLSLAEPFAVAMHGIRSMQKQVSLENKRVLVVGGGAVGLCAALLLTKYCHMEQVALYESDSRKAEFIRSLFSIRLACPTGHSEEGYRSLYESGEYDLAFEASGSCAGAEMAMDSLRPGGTVCLYGLSAGYRADLNKAVVKRLCITGSIGGSGEFDTVIRFLHQHQADAKKLITGRYPLEQAFQAFESRRNGVSLQIKNQIIITGGGTCYD